MEELEQIINNLNIEVGIQILIAIGVILVFRILSSIISGIIIRILRPKNKEKINKYWMKPVNTASGVNNYR